MYVCVFMNVCMYVCTYVCVRACVCITRNVCACACACMCVYALQCAASRDRWNGYAWRTFALAHGALFLFLRWPMARCAALRHGMHVTRNEAGLIAI